MFSQNIATCQSCCCRTCKYVILPVHPLYISASLGPKTCNFPVDCKCIAQLNTPQPWLYDISLCNLCTCMKQMLKCFGVGGKLLSIPQQLETANKSTIHLFLLQKRCEVIKLTVWWQKLVECPHVEVIHRNLEALIISNWWDELKIELLGEAFREIIFAHTDVAIHNNDLTVFTNSRVGIIEEFVQQRIFLFLVRPWFFVRIGTPESCFESGHLDRSGARGRVNLTTQQGFHWPGTGKCRPGCNQRHI